MKILMTGFEPFGGETVNPSWEAVRGIRAVPDGTELVRLMLPVSFRKAPEKLREAIRVERPDIVLCIGQAGGREAVTPERIAVNLKDASIADNDGDMPSEEPIEKEGENALFSTLPVKRIAEAIAQAGVPSAVSNTAGLYVCNTVLYEALFTASRNYPSMKVGFIHVPFLPEQAERKNAPGLALEEDIRALEAALAVLV
ncbi:MAG: pyroglutamyl-peptidase I [Lachnospiraceae bacterium]|nr:pyroglutamyl-peptidase I [Lachnospiraceae bacterium]